MRSLAPLFVVAAFCLGACGSDFEEDRCGRENGCDLGMSCEHDSDCAGAFRCQAGAGETKSCQRPDGSCQLDAHCPDGRACRGGDCAWGRCIFDSDCTSGFVCDGETGACLVPCEGDRDCDAGTGCTARAFCAPNDASCVDDAGCAANERCVEARCTGDAEEAGA